MGLGENSTGVAKTAHSPALPSSVSSGNLHIGVSRSAFFRRHRQPALPSPPPKTGRDRHSLQRGSLASLVGALEDSVGHMAHRPDKVEMEFGASLSGDCDLWVVSGEGKADFKVKLAWNKGT
jgi:hypothetical protein